jgi:hypothetical protein
MSEMFEEECQCAEERALGSAMLIASNVTLLVAKATTRLARPFRVLPMPMK